MFHVLLYFGSINSGAALRSRATSLSKQTSRCLIPSSSYATTRILGKGAPHPAEGFLSGTSTVYIDSMYEMWKQDPKSVHGSWNVYFKNVDAGLAPVRDTIFLIFLLWFYGLNS